MNLCYNNYKGELTKKTHLANLRKWMNYFARDQPLWPWRPTAMMVLQFSIQAEGTNAWENHLHLTAWIHWAQSSYSLSLSVTADQSVLHEPNDCFVVLRLVDSLTLTQQKWGRLEWRVHSRLVASLLLPLWSNGIWTTNAMAVVLHYCMKMLHLHLWHAVSSFVDASEISVLHFLQLRPPGRNTRTSRIQMDYKDICASDQTPSLCASKWIL